MPWVDSLDWTSLNALRRYPLREGSNVLSVDESFSIPDTLIVDFTLCASSDVSRRFFISRIFNKLAAVVIEVSDFAGVVLGTLEVQNSTHTQDTDYYLTIAASYAGANGKITIGSLDDLKYQPAGDFAFTQSSTEFEPRTIIPGLQGVDRITFIDSDNGQQTVSGDVILASRNNLSFSYTQSRTILDAGDNLGLNKTCTTNVCIQSINGVLPDPANGNINLLGIDCVKVSSAEEHTLELEDTCCTPCSGCNDLEELTVRLTSLENKFLDIKNNYNAVNQQLNNYLSTINSNCAC
jgi:hypothetical protein